MIFISTNEKVLDVKTKFIAVYWCLSLNCPCLSLNCPCLPLNCPCLPWIWCSILYWYQSWYQIYGKGLKKFVEMSTLDFFLRLLNIADYICRPDPSTLVDTIQDTRYEMECVSFCCKKVLPCVRTQTNAWKIVDFLFTFCTWTDCMSIALLLWYLVVFRSMHDQFYQILILCEMSNFRNK